VIFKMKNILFILLLPILTFAQKEVVIHIKTDGYPSETRWVLYDSAYQGDTIDYVDYGHYTQPNFMHRDTLYIDSVQNISFVIYDSYGDGIINGEYYVTICGDTVVDYPVSTFTSGLIHNRAVPQCLPNPPPPLGPCVPTMININLDQFTDETSWEITDTMGNVLISGGPYPNVPDYQPQYIPTCLPTGVLRFTIFDTYGDGLAGSQWGGNDGSYYLIQCGDTLVLGTTPNFGTDSTHVFISDTCIPPPPVPGCMDNNYIEFNPAATVSDSSCATLKIYGCTDSTMFNYDSTANTMDYIDSCDYTLVLHDLAGNGWVGSRLEIYQDDTFQFVMTSGFNQTYILQLKAPKLVRAKFFINQQASQTTPECGFTLINPMGDTVISVKPPFMQPFFVYGGITYCGNECIEIVEGCMDSTAFNYDSTANMPLPCYYVPGCMSPAYLEYHIDTSNGVYTDFNIQDSCNTLAVFGCTDTASFNYDSIANVDNGGCVPIVLGCMETFAFNYNPLANTDDGSCVPYIYGCIDPTMFNYDPNANTDNGSCIPFIYGCTDSTAFNYDPNANADNGSCIQFISGCMDSDAWNYNASANVNDTSACLYAANCITGPGNPYFLNDPCYAWVIDVDEYCCTNDWDSICQLTYDYCEGTWVGPIPQRVSQLIMITDILGRPAIIEKNKLLFFIYRDGTVEKKFIK
tara:strand:+ start:59 stop:2125 length:2067 start_codon:yes stop_codon:yes gene_type:complete